MANQMTITFSVSSQTLTRTDTNTIVEKSKNYLHAEFTFSDDWEDTTKAVIIDNDGFRYKVYLDDDDSCDIPNRAVSHDGFMLTVVGEDSDNYITITSSDLFISVKDNNYTSDSEVAITEITSDTLEVTQEEGSVNIEIPDTYLTEDDVDQTYDSESEKAQSGVAVAEALETKQDVLTFDTTPTEESTNPVTSGGIKTYTDNLVEEAKAEIQDGSTIDSFADVETALEEKQDVISGSDSIDVTSNVVSVNQTYIDEQFLTADEMNDLIEEVYGSEYILQR